MDKILNSLGFGPISNTEELKNFRKMFQGFDFQCDPSKIDPEKIWDKPAPITITGKDYHKRTILAAEIVFQLHQEWTLGHLKLQKLIYLCQNTTEMSLTTNFLKQAMGPYDPRLMRSIDKKLLENDWFQYTQGSFPQYKKLKNAGDHREWFSRYFSKEMSAISDLISIFRKAKGEQVELVATVYACCSELKNEGKIITDLSVIQKVYSWSIYKKKFSEERIRKAHEWMQHKGIYPK